MNAPHAEINKNAIETARAFLKGEPFFTAKMEKDVNKLAQLLLTTWNQSAAKHTRADDTWYEEEENQYGVTLVPVEFSVTLPPTDTDTETLPKGEKK
jgi:hypothetical protein